MKFTEQDKAESGNRGLRETKGTASDKFTINRSILIQKKKHSEILFQSAFLFNI